MHKILAGLLESWWMFFDTFWALLFGFAISGLIQALVSRDRMQHILGDHRPKAIGKASFYGMVSSSCSYAASALARSIFIKGGDFTASMVFMFASTNLVVELGIVLWMLIGWQFAAAEFVGGAIMILLLASLIPRLFKESEIQKALSVASGNEVVANERGISSSEGEATTKARSWRGNLSNAAGFTIGDFTMLRVELVVGFIVAGLASTVIPFSWWNSLFITGHGFVSNLENAIIGPVLACISFVCSVGNVPLAVALWSAGITFGGVISFIFADLVAFPLLMIYKKYYGGRFTAKLVLLFWTTMSISGILTERIFSFLGITPKHRALSRMSSVHAGFNATTLLNVGAFLLLVGIIYLYRTRQVGDGDSDFAIDPICGMQVRKSDAPATAQIGGIRYYFCMEGCKEKFLKVRK